ncbi:sensor histidine kinase [Radiobacillus kanasensis]|uniref:sensor histidine kinase n=1 Tax=Radiobacillus kanasensis TaxID=2844358 RepID=UPI001E585EBE|nr:sensor histidine kinase [Radiobacillus kanasensis]UFT98573.1 sensor histidine kinase [Radiobacillus kanasensis]
MKTIRGKLIIYFFVFVVLFNVVSISIYVSSKQLTGEYHASFERFVTLNSISQISNKLYQNVKTYVMEPSEENLDAYYTSLNQLEEEENQLMSSRTFEESMQIKNYTNLIDSLIHESEITVGFVLRDDIERYTAHLKETQSAATYIQETTLHLIDLELNEYQVLYEDLQERNSSFQWFIFFLFSTTVMLAIGFSLWFSYGITKPIQALSKAAKQVSSGQISGEPVVIDSNDELKLLGDSFNQMRTNIHELIEEIKQKSEQEKLMKELELKHLQNQINPHFLFNTLNTISKLAYLENAKSTSNLIDSVATLLRYSLGDLKKSISLKDELQVIEEYLSIQKTRFLERIQYKMDIQSEHLDIPIPRLTIQPIVENAFIHGIEAKEDGGKILIRIYDQDEYTMVEIEDDGIGMDEKTILRLLDTTADSEEHIGHSTGIGMTNVIRRLQLFYQTEHVLEIDSEVDRGTIIRLVLPNQWKRTE